MTSRHRALRRTGLVIAAVILLAWPILSWLIPVGYCPDPGECVVVYGGGPVGWVVSALLVVIAVLVIRAAVRTPRRPGP